MAHFLGLGLTHYPLLAGTDEHMASLLRWTLTDPDIPESAKDPQMPSNLERLPRSTTLPPAPSLHEPKPSRK